MPGGESDTIQGDGTQANSSATVTFTSGDENLTINNAYVTLSQTSGNGTFTINNSLLILTGNASPQFVHFGTGASALQLSVANYTNFGVNGVGISGFVTGDAIIAPPGYFISKYSYAGRTLTIDLTPNGQAPGGSTTHTVPIPSVAGPNGAPIPPGDLQLNSNSTILSDGAYTGPGACFVVGTLISTPRGEVAVEALQVGDLVTTLAGAARPIVWIGRGSTLATASNRLAAAPVIVRAGALADNVPCRDLHLIKAHALYLDDVFVPVECLINGRSIIRDERPHVVEFFHIELESHDVLVADGAPAESYREDENGMTFQTPRPAWAAGMKPCAPVLTAGPVVARIWQRLDDRAGPRAHIVTTRDPELHLLADDLRIDAAQVQGGEYLFQLARWPAVLHLVSRSAAPCDLGLSGDGRPLGVAVSQVVLRDGAAAVVLPFDAGAEGGLSCPRGRFPLDQWRCGTASASPGRHRWAVRGAGARHRHRDLSDAVAVAGGRGCLKTRPGGCRRRPGAGAPPPHLVV